jgi:hypothetical protein
VILALLIVLVLGFLPLGTPPAWEAFHNDERTRELMRQWSGR